MKNIQWKVIRHLERRDNRYIRLEVDESIASISSFFHSLADSNYPSIIEEAIQGIGHDINGAGITFPGDLDDYDLTQREPIPYNMMEVYDPIGGIQIPQNIYFQILLEVGEALLSVKKEIGDTSKEWEEKMEKALADLRLRLG